MHSNQQEKETTAWNLQFNSVSYSTVSLICKTSCKYLDKLKSNAYGQIFFFLYLVHTVSIRQQFISMIQRSNRFSSSSHWIDNFWCKLWINHVLHKKLLLSFAEGLYLTIVSSPLPLQCTQKPGTIFCLWSGDKNLIVKNSVHGANTELLSFVVPFFMWWCSSVNAFYNRSAWLACFSFGSFRFKNPIPIRMSVPAEGSLLQSWRAEDCKNPNFALEGSAQYSIKFLEI